MTRGLSPAATYQTYPAEKKRRNFKEEQHFRRAAEQLFSADFLSSLSQQLFSAALLSSVSQQPFSAALLSSSSQQRFSAALLSSFSQLSQQPFSAALLSSFSQQPFSAALLSSSSPQIFSAIILLWSGVGGQLVTSSSAAPSAALLSSSSQQIFSAALLSYHLAVVRGWWSAVTSSSAALLSYHLAVVRGWWSSMLPFFRRTLSQRFRENYVTKKKGHGQTRAMGQEPNIIRLAMTELEKVQDPQSMTEAMVNGKIMEIKGKMLLQMGIPTSISLTIAYPEYAKRLGLWGRADQQVTSQVPTVPPKPKSTPKTPAVPPQLQETVEKLEQGIKKDWRHRSRP